MQGPNTQPKPWGWNVVENAKWQSWKQLGDMPAVEAMRLYVRSLEEEQVLGCKIPLARFTAITHSVTDKTPLLFCCVNHIRAMLTCHLVLCAA